MRVYGRIECGIWRNRKFRDMSDDARQLYMYLLTCPHGNSIGLFYLPAGYIQTDIGWDGNRIETVMETLSERLIERDREHDLVLIRGWFGHNDIENPNVAKGALKSLEELPDSPLKAAVIKGMAALERSFITPLIKPFLNHSETVSKPFRNPEPKPEPEPEPIAAVAASRAPPLALAKIETDEAVRRCCNEIGCRESADGTDHIRMVGWLKLYDLETFILPAISRKAADSLASGKPIRALKYFDDFLKDAAAAQQRLTTELSHAPVDRSSAAAVQHRGSREQRSAQGWDDAIALIQAETAGAAH